VIKEIPRLQRYAGRPHPAEIFSRKTRDKSGRNEEIYQAHVKFGYTLKEIADRLDIHYTTVSKAIKGMENKK
jgi:DNA-binding CsgD family transcriptional regulator